LALKLISFYIRFFSSISLAPYGPIVAARVAAISVSATLRTIFLPLPLKNPWRSQYVFMSSVCLFVVR